MRFFGKLAFATALATATAATAVLPVTSAAAKEQKLKNSKAFAEAYTATKAEVDSGDAAGAKQAYQNAIAAIENEDDRYIAGGLGLEVAKVANDDAVKKQAYDLFLASESTPASTKTQVATELAFSEYNAKNYQQAVSYVDMARQLGSTDPQLSFVSGLSKLSQQNNAGYDELRQAIQGMQAKGEQAPEQWYALAASNAIQSKNSTEQAYWTRAQLEAYPTEENWRTALVTYQYDTNTLSNSQMMDLFRLRARAGTLTQPIDYEDYVKSVTLNDQIIQPTEALFWLDKGVQSGVIDGSQTYFAEAISGAKAGKSSDASGYEAREQSAISANNERRLQSVADVAFDQGRYARAIELYDLAGKAGAQADLVALRQGIANYELGNMAAARANFESVTTAPGSDIAGFWLLYLDQNASQTAAATTTAQ